MLSFAGGGKKQRLSNMEALRIVAMSMILIHHFLVHGLTPELIPHHLYYIVGPFFLCGVDLFFLISGHFGIRFSVSKALKLSLTVVYFSVINVLILWVLGVHVPVKGLIDTLFYSPVGSGYWFLRVYLLLMISSPIVNAGLRALSREQLRNTLLLSTAVILYVKGHMASYNYLNAAYMYCIGYYVRQYGLAKPLSCGKLLAIFFVFSALGSVQSLAASIVDISSYALSYDSLVLIVASVSLYLCFARMTFSLGWVNSLAAASFGCYLLQDGALGLYWLYEAQGMFVTTHGYGMQSLAMFAATFVALWAASWVLTEFMNLWIGPLAVRVEAFIRRVVAWAAPGLTKG